MRKKTLAITVISFLALFLGLSMILVEDFRAIVKRWIEKCKPRQLLKRLKGMKRHI